MNWIKALLSGSRDIADDSAVAGLFLVFGFVGNSAWAIFQHPELWNPLTYGSGAAALAAGVGAMFKLRGN